MRKFNRFQSKLQFNIKRYRYLSKFLSEKEKIIFLNNIYEYMNVHFMNIWFYFYIKYEKKHKEVFLSGMKTTKKLLELGEQLNHSDEILLPFKDNLKSYLKKMDIFTDVKIVLLSEFGEDITECILEFL